MTTVQAPNHESKKARDDSRQLLRHNQESDESSAFDAQRLYGNAALGVGGTVAAAGDPGAIVQRARIVVQAKLTVGPVDDAYEQEADSVAESVVQRLSAPPVQRQEDEEELQMKRTGDTVQRQEDEEELQMKRTGDTVQRQEEEEELQMKSLEGPGPTELDPGLESQIQRARTGGSALEPGARTSMEGAIGSDFSGVRVHTGAESDSLNRSLSARAFTTGNDIFFRSGEYSPATSQGQRLLAHELTHVVQQGGAGLRTKRMQSDLQRKRAQSELFFG